MPDTLVGMVDTAMNKNLCPHGDYIPVRRDQNKRISTVVCQRVTSPMEGSYADKLLSKTWRRGIQTGGYLAFGAERKFSAYHNVFTQNTDLILGHLLF